ncbi:Polyketide biosynthesis 3-hydroxy-3 -methylglutaryl-ACP synthase pksG [Legionella beliardensis]|uniref:Polyketide biosynthesis 3-hydroxy-3 -methylglutaryl-ACP synthase pksG n=1 Tax=Legionella beliardensis TaxID=91822 RepID=A0A378JR04_9GAMM|nr:hydroxymethylglutaryl-CoA synthase [Legionella beliardensis]STX55617.1 Polyketide biosynthesis 3-hydroxy-3 -methylglutaryl-ACP synthase pksG [Legionella beliardensis]
MSNENIGITAVGLHFPSLAMDVTELAKLRNTAPEKFTLGLGCREFSLCSQYENIADLAANAAQKALAYWPKSIDDIGMVVVGTESGLDMSRPVSAWVAEKLNLSGMIRSYEVKHACYGGTLAIKQAVEWKLSGAGGNKAALVIAADISLYEPQSGAEPTQGAGAVAFIIDKDPQIAGINALSYPWSRPVFDFWRPLNKKFPEVNGEYSLECYKEAVLNCYNLLIKDIGINALELEFSAHCFHVPFPKMVRKAVFHFFQHQGWTDEKIEDYLKEKIEPTMVWNQLTGNCYTASLWIAVAKALAHLKPKQKLSAFSYGSGYGAELLTLTAGPQVSSPYWVAEVEKMLLARQKINSLEYELLRQNY